MNSSKAPMRAASNPIRLKGDTSCRYGDPDCNRCANDVRGEFARLSMTGWKGGSWKMDTDARYPPDRVLAKDAFHTVKADYHIQGFVHTNSAEYPYAGSHSMIESKHGSIFFIGSAGKMKALHESEEHHPSGVTVLGDVLFVEENSGIRWFEVSDAESDQNHRWPELKTGGGGGLGLAKLQDGSTLLVTTDPGGGFRLTHATKAAREDDARIRHTRFFRLVGALTGAEPPTVSYLGEFEHPFGPGRCETGMEQSGALCYRNCPDGYKGVGPVCWERCPAGYTDDGATCRKPVDVKAKASYGRGAGKPMGCASDEEMDGALCYRKCGSGYNGVGPVCWQNCPSGFRNDGAFCKKPKAYGRGRGRSNKKCERRHGDGNCEKNAGLWYKKCRAGFHNVGCCICSPNCSSGMKDIGVSCQKQSSTRGAGSPLHTCSAKEQKDGALCYPRCKAGYNGVGPVCWAEKCPTGYKDDGATCRKPGDINAKKSSRRGVGEPLSPKTPMAYSENLSVVTECGTGDIYTVHTTGTYDLYGTGYWRLSKAEGGTEGPRLKYISMRKQDQNADNCHQRSSATVSVDPNGRLEFLCSERRVLLSEGNYRSRKP